MQRRLYLVLLGLVLFLPLLGYIWPQSPGTAATFTERTWQWPARQLIKEIEPQPTLLARFWPIQAPKIAPDKELATQTPASAQTMQLVAIIKQGSQQQALVLTPSGELKTLNQGDALDETRQVLSISDNSLRWQTINAESAPDKKPSNKPAKAEPELEPEQGEISLFPKPV